MALKHVVVDGSNIATEGRNLPSLEQLDEAVQAFLADEQVDKLTVVVDATFGHRIPERERAEYDEAIVNGELVCPPAGAIGRGDAFVLQIADKSGATILSNDSFQEFHGEYDWLFDDDRLIGGKPVPEVGWVFVKRTPVRGPISRNATKNARGPRRPRRSSTKAALEVEGPKQPPVPTGRPPRVGDVGMSAAARAKADKQDEAAKAPGGRPRKPAAKAAPGSETKANDAKDNGQSIAAKRTGRSRRGNGGAKPKPTNELLPFLEFVGSHPVGSQVEAEVERFSSHGAYLKMGEILGYAPLRVMGDPPPRSPRDLFDMGKTYTLTVVAFDTPRRGVDLTLPEFAGAAMADAEREGAIASAVSPEDVPAPPDKAEETPTMATPRKASKKKAAAKKAPVKKKVAKKATAAKKTVKRKAAAVKKTAAKKATKATKTVAKKTAAAKRSTAGKKAASTRKAKATKRSVAAKKGAATRKSTKR